MRLRFRGLQCGGSVRGGGSVAVTVGGGVCNTAATLAAARAAVQNAPRRRFRRCGDNRAAISPLLTRRSATGDVDDGSRPRSS